MKEISKNIKCLLMRSGVEIWLEDEYLKNFKTILLNSRESKFVEIGDEIINTADLTGVFTPATMEDRTRRKNGQFQGGDGEWHNKGDYECRYGYWHEQYEKCGHTNKLGYKD